VEIERNEGQLNLPHSVATLSYIFHCMLSTSFCPPKVFDVQMQLFWEKNYEMARMCFKQAGETDWEKRAKAAYIMETAEQIRYSDPERAHINLLEAAEIFLSIGRFKSAAECFYDLKDYKQAGMKLVILRKCSFFFFSSFSAASHFRF